MGIEQRDPAYRWAVPVDDFVDGVRGAKRTSQRAELLAAMEGLRRVELLEGEVERKVRAYGHGGGHVHGHGHGPKSKAWVVASDSECVVRGVDGVVSYLAGVFFPLCFTCAMLRLILWGRRETGGGRALASRLPT